MFERALLRSKWMIGESLHCSTGSLKEGYSTGSPAWQSSCNGRTRTSARSFQTRASDSYMYPVYVSQFLKRFFASAPFPFSSFQKLLCTPRNLDQQARRPDFAAWLLDANNFSLHPEAEGEQRDNVQPHSSLIVYFLVHLSSTKQVVPRNFRLDSSRSES